jgi:protein MpaA
MRLALIGPACVRVLAALLALPATSCVVQAPASDTPGAVAVRTVTPGAVASSTVAAGMRRSAPVPGDRPAVTDVRVLGTTREGRRIRAYRVGDRTARRSAVVLSTMHGDERATRHIVTNLRDGAPVHGIDLWLVPMYNPDGFAARDRYNSRGVDLNRNFPRRWTSQPHSGRRPASERETRSFVRFLDRVDPDRVVSFHQPLHGVDTSHDKRPAFLRRLSEQLRLPLERMDCDGGCHGTMTQWFNAGHSGFAVTVELSADPSRRYLRGRGPRGLLRALGGRR